MGQFERKLTPSQAQENAINQSLTKARDLFLCAFSPGSSHVGPPGPSAAESRDWAVLGCAGVAQADGITVLDPDSSVGHCAHRPRTSPTVRQS